MYRTHQWGGADVVVLAAIGVFFGGSFDFAFAYFIDLFVVAFVYSIAWALFEAWKNKNVKKRFVASVREKYHEFFALIVLAILAVAVPFMATAYKFGANFAFAVVTPLYIVVPAIPGFWFLFKFVRAVESECFRLTRTSETLVEFDLLVEDLWIVDGKVKRVPTSAAKAEREGKKIVVNSSDPAGLSPEQVAEIRKLVADGKLDDGFVVKWGLPFIPVFPLALLVAWKWGNLIELLL